MKTLTIYGEAHYGNQQDQKRYEQIVTEAKKEHLILLNEGRPYQENIGNIYGIEDFLLLNFSNNLKVLRNLSRGIHTIIKNFQLPDTKDIPNKIFLMDEQSRKKFTHLAAIYLDNIFSLARRKQTGQATLQLLQKHKISEELNVLFRKYRSLFTNLNHSVNNDQFGKEFFTDLLKIQPAIDLVLKDLCFVLLSNIRKKYAAVSDLNNLADTELVAFFEDILSKQKTLHDYKIFNEIAVKLRNTVIADNILTILKAQSKMDKSVLVIGSDHLGGLKVIFNSRLQECEQIGLRIEYPLDDEKMILQKPLERPESPTIHPDDQKYGLTDKTKLVDSPLITLLKTKTKLNFYGVKNQSQRIDALVEITDEQIRKKAQNLQSFLKGHGRFINIGASETIFVLEGINSQEGSPPLGKCIYEALSSTLDSEGTPKLSAEADEPMTAPHPAYSNHPIKP